MKKIPRDKLRNIDAGKENERINDYDQNNSDQWKCAGGNEEANE